MEIAYIFLQGDKQESSGICSNTTNYTWPDLSPVLTSESQPTFWTWMYGVYASIMVAYSLTVFAVFTFNRSWATKSNNYWFITGWVMSPLWLLCWSFWLFNMIVDNKGYSTHKFFVTKF